MAKSDPSVDEKITQLQNKEAMLEPAEPEVLKYNPNKRRRAIRRQVYERFYQLRDDGARKDAEAEWDMADKEYTMAFDTEFDPDDPDNWRADLHLPDAFAAIQAQSQETVERRARPILRATESSDQAVQDFANAVITYNMNNTDFDYQYFLAKLAASIRGTAFMMDYWRRDTRIVREPSGQNEDGTFEYTAKEIVDFDDDYAEWVPNEFIYIDEKAKHINEAVDMFRREILNIEEFYRIYGDRPGFFDTEFVVAGGDTRTSTISAFKPPADITMQDVEILHYYNRAIDAYWVVANNITIYDDPLPTKHKELPVAVVYQYRVPGRFWGIGIPKVIHHLSEERRSIRNLNMDRQKLQLNKMFIHNNAFDIDDEDLVSRPHGLISVDTGGQPAQNALVPVEYGDVPASYFKTEEILLEDIRRAHGIDDRIQGVNVGGTATEAAILKESALKRVNLISITAEMDTIIRIGRLKWSNIQHLYGTPRLDAITQDNEEREEKTFRKISVQGKKFEIADVGGGKKGLKMEDVKGGSSVELDPKMAKYLEGSFDVTIDSDIFTPISKAIEQTKKTEMFTVMTGNPALLGLLDLNSAAADVLAVNDIKPDKWLRNPDNSRKDQMMLAESENMVMLAGQPLNGTKDASEDHTLVHLMFTKTPDYLAAPHEIQQLIQDHILQEHDANPATGSSADLLQAFGLGAQPGAAPGAGGPVPPGMGTPFNAGASPATPGPTAQVADLQPANSSAPA